MEYLTQKQAEIERMAAGLQVEQIEVDHCRRLPGGSGAATLAWLASNDLASWPEPEQEVGVAAQYTVDSAPVDGGGSLDWLAKMPIAGEPGTARVSELLAH